MGAGHFGIQRYGNGCQALINQALILFQVEFADVLIRKSKYQIKIKIP